MCSLWSLSMTAEACLPAVSRSTPETRVTSPGLSQGSCIVCPLGVFHLPQSMAYFGVKSNTAEENCWQDPNSMVKGKILLDPL